MDHNTSILLVLGVVMVAGTVVGLITKAIKLPSVTGQILVGIAIGPAGLALFDMSDVHRLKPLIDFALGLMAVAVGSHLIIPKLRAALRRVTLLLLFEAILTPLLVFLVVISAPRTDWRFSLLVATIAVSTAPATILALVKEARAKGVFVTTLVVAVALNNLACICLFEVSHAIVRASLDPHLGQSSWQLVIGPLKEILASIALGGGVGAILVWTTGRVVRTDRITALSMMAILLAVGLADHFGISVMLSCLTLGITLANLTPDKEEIGHRVFENFEYAIYAIFFTVAGMELEVAYLIPGGTLALLAFGARCGGKMGAAFLGMRLAGATERVRRWLGVALIPQAGLAVGLMLLVTEDSAFSSLRDLFLAVVLTMVLLAEIIGPIMTRLALHKSGDAGKDRERVINFLREDNITTDLKGATPEEAIRQLVDLTVKSNRLRVSADDIFAQVMERERSSSTCLGDGLALPHAHIDIEAGITGAMGISSAGLPFPSLDGRPVHCMVLILTPTHMPERHLEVLSALAKAIGSDRTIQQQLYHADSPAHAYELLHVNEGTADFNVFLDEENPQ